MFLTMLKAKLHRATVTRTELDYEGSISIDRDLMDRAGILPYEQVDVLNINNGERFTTYVIESPRGSREIGINGAAARRAQPRDKVIICAYRQIPEEEGRNYAPTVVLLDGSNGVITH
jgi:aspartate 1-decarboxylase